MKNVSAGLVVALLLGLVLGVGLIQAFTNFTGGIELRPAAPVLLQTSTMSVGAPTNVSSANKTFDVPVNIANANNLGAYEYDLMWSTAGLLTVNSVVQGTFLGNPSPTPVPGVRQLIALGPLTGTAGQVSVGAATCPVADCQGDPGQTKITTGASGSGILSTVTFHVPGSVPGGGGGYLNLTLNNAQITDVDANVQGLNTVNRSIGVFPYAFTVGSSPTDLKYNTMCMPVKNSGINTAQQLGTYIGGVKKIQQWLAGSQQWQTYIPGSPFNPSYDLILGGAYFVQVDNNASSSVLIVGDAPAAGEMKYTLARGQAPACQWNFICIPPEKASITTAQALGNDIGGAKKIQQWLAGTQQWQSYIPGSPFNPSFPVEVGVPYLVCLDDSAGGVVWP